MASYPLPEHLQAVRDSLSYEDLRRLSQEILDEYATSVYATGLKEGREQLLKEQREAREKRRVPGTRRKQWATAVYFIVAPQAIKIGMSNNPERRLGVLQTSHPEPLSLAATCEGGKQLEREYHARFAAHRLTGEWFTPHPDILAEIDRLNSGASV